MMRALVFAAMVALAGPARADYQTFGGNECTVDCSGHAAGYEWAERKGITDEADCYSRSQSFEEGCRTYLDDPYRGYDEDDDGNALDN